MTAVIFTAAWEEVRRGGIKSEKGGGQGWTAGLNKDRTFIQETDVPVQGETRSPPSLTYMGAEVSSRT